MIIDLKRFIETERPFWQELERRLYAFEEGTAQDPSLQELERFHYLYERTAADLARVATFASEPNLHRYLESLTARAYGEIHDTRQRRHRFRPLQWFFRTLPLTFRRHARAFALAAAITLLGSLFGAIAVSFDADAKEALVPAQFAHLMQDPAERVAREESMGSFTIEQTEDGQMLAPGPGSMTRFSAQLMTNNIGVSLKALAFGITYGIGTLLLLFYNGIILGLVGADYIAAGQTVFLLGWLLPHGSVEIPSILIGGQTGLMLAGALIGWGRRETLLIRLRLIMNDLVTLAGGLAVFLVWAGLVEAFFSQYHAPIIPYWVKIMFGSVELVLLILFLGFAGRPPRTGSNSIGQPSPGNSSSTPSAPAL